jgi:hypothetical protein
MPRNGFYGDSVERKNIARWTHSWKSSNDMLVTIMDHAIDRTGKSWVYISKFSDGKPVGWVFREFISCNRSMEIAAASGFVF